MYKFLSIVLIASLVASCSGSGNFQKQKFTNLKISKASTQSDLEMSSTSSEIQERVSEQNQSSAQTTMYNEQDQKESPKASSLIIENPRVEDSEPLDNAFNQIQEIEELEISSRESEITAQHSNDEGDEGVRNDFAFKALILLILALVVPVIGFFFLIAALVFSIKARKQIREAPAGTYNNESAANIVFWVSFVILAFPIFITAAVLIAIYGFGADFTGFWF